MRRPFFLAAAALLAALSLPACSPAHGDPAPAAPVPQSWPADAGAALDVAWEPSSGRTALLGDGRRARDGGRPGPCVAGEILSEPRSGLFRRLARPLSRTELGALLGYRPGTRERVEVLTETVLTSLAAPDPYSPTYAYGVVHRVRSDALDPARLTFTGALGQPSFFEVCGDEVALRAEMGGAAVLALDLRFADPEARRELEAAVGAEPALWDLLPLLGADSPLGARVAAVVVAFQIGGETDAFLDWSARAAWCGSPDAARCLGAIRHFVGYVTSGGPGSFAEAVRQRPQPLGHAYGGWSELGLPGEPEAIPAVVVLAREHLHGLLEEQLRIRVRVNAFRAWRDGRIEAFDAASAASLGAVQAALLACYGLASPGDAAGAAACVEASTLRALVAAGYDPGLALADLPMP